MKGNKYMNQSAVRLVDNDGDLYVFNDTNEIRFAIIGFSDVSNLVTYERLLLIFKEVADSDVKILYEARTNSFVSEENVDGVITFYSLSGDELNNIVAERYCSREQYLKLNKKIWMAEDINAYNINFGTGIDLIRSIYSRIDETFYLLIKYKNKYYAVGPKAVELKAKQVCFYSETNGIRKWLFTGVLFDEHDDNWFIL